jgi:hypothetical protein
MRLLPFRIRLRQQRTRFSQPESQLPEQPLALAHS